LVAATHSFPQALLTVVVCILLVALELFVAALIVAPRWVGRKLVSLLRAPAQRAQRVLRPSLRQREAPRPSRERA